MTRRLLTCVLFLSIAAATRTVEAVPTGSQWLAAAIGGATTQPTEALPALVVKRQDHGELTMNRSVVGQPMTIGTRTFEHGLGTHSNSEIVIRLAPGSAKSLHAFAGVNSNNGASGSVDFTIEIAGKQVYHSGVRRGGDEAVEVNVDIPADADQVVLKVADAGDGPAFDHADWADAKLILADASEKYLDAIPPPTFWPAATSIPFSFVFDGKSSQQVLGGWQKQSADGKTSWTDPATKLKVTAESRAFDDFGAVEWLLRFENTGDHDSPILENVQALDVSVPNGGGNRPATLDQINGDDASPNSFAPTSREIQSGQHVALAPQGGRPSNGTFPMFAVESGSDHLFVAIGWTGQWAADVARDAQGVHLKAGMELTHLRLHPGESIRSPRILLMPARGDRVDAHNQFRRLLLAHYVPRVKGELPKFAVAAQTFNMVFGAGIRQEWATEAGQIAAAKIEKQIGCDTHWFDAGWFEGNFPNGVGNWTVKPKEFPRGLKPVGDACDQLGLRFLVWYEPERVAPNTKVAREHPEFILSAGQPKLNGGLFNLGDPKARQWMTDLILGQMNAYGIDQYRNDFNMDPLPYWRANDEPDRQGITEIRYVEGFYQWWDAIRAARPDVIPDDCASGGRRIDLEMVMRSIVQTRSDAAVAPGRSDWHQCESYGLSQFLPLHATIAWETDAYATRSAGASGICMEWDILDPKFPIEAARAGIDEIKSNQKYWQGDFYPLTSYSFSTDVWLAWQLDRPDLHEGIALVFRRGDCPFTAMQVEFRAIKPDATYAVQLVDDQRKVETRSMLGKDLRGMELKLPQRKSSMLIRYKMQ